MIDELIDTIRSLTSLMEEESDKLVAPGRHPELAECTAAKIRLVASLEAQTAQLNREQPEWMAALAPELREQVIAAIGALHDASLINADVLSRQIELSTEMIAAVSAEVQRLTGTGSATYDAQGGLFQAVQATPISLNTRL